jgi:hypothetical protein
MNITPSMLEDAARFSNFAQKFKMLMWNMTLQAHNRPLTEDDYDTVALELWKYLDLPTKN